MPIIPNPQSEFYREPNLLIPRKKPVGQVRADLGHPHLKGCVSWWPLIRGNPRDIVGQHHATYTGGAYRSANARYVDSSMANGTGLRVADHDDFTSQSGFTAIVDIKLTEAPTENIGLLSHYLNGDRSWSLQIDHTGMEVFGSFSTDGEYEVFWDIVGSSIAVGTQYILAITWTPARAAIYIDGDLDIEDFTTASSLNDCAEIIGLGGPHHEDVIERCVYGYYYWARFYNRALSDKEIKSIYEDPWEPALSA